jgi:Arc/MetJ family transcription regulator
MAVEIEREHWMPRLKVERQLADEAAKILGAKSRSDAVHIALREIVALGRFKKLLKQHAGKLKFAGHGDSARSAYKC